MTELPPLKRYLRRRSERGSVVHNNTSPSFSSPFSMEPEEVPPTIFLPAGPLQVGKDSDAGALVILNDEPFTGHKPMIPGNLS